MDHFRNPRNVGVIEDANGIGEVGNAKCGDIMKMYLKIEDGIVEDVKFETFGCGSAIASSSMATELIKGKPVTEAMKLTNKAVAEALDGLPAYIYIILFFSLIYIIPLFSLIYIILLFCIIYFILNFCFIDFFFNFIFLYIFFFLIF